MIELYQRSNERFFSGLQEHLSADGAVFVGFPAWQMPFGGHQQIAHSHIVSHFPFLHLLPRTLYRWILRLCGEQERVIMELLDIKSTGCTIELFNRIARQANYQIIDRRLYLITHIIKSNSACPHEGSTELLLLSRT